MGGRSNGLRRRSALCGVVRLTPDGLEFGFRNFLRGKLRIAVDVGGRWNRTFGHLVPPVVARIAAGFEAAVAILSDASHAIAVCVEFVVIFDRLVLVRVEPDRMEVTVGGADTWRRGQSRCQFSDRAPAPASARASVAQLRMMEFPESRMCHCISSIASRSGITASVTSPASSRGRCFASCISAPLAG